METQENQEIQAITESQDQSDQKDQMVVKATEELTVPLETREHVETPAKKEFLERTASQEKEE